MIFITCITSFLIGIIFLRILTNNFWIKFWDNEDLSISINSNDLECERGITILAKTTALDYKDTRINILDTPGHVDFGKKVEQKMVKIKKY